jgi:endonuclease/exonuclease/phosphatase (EEP) superfamily protein YafD
MLLAGRIVAVVGLMYTISYGALLLLLRFAGERFWLSSLLLYLPLQVWLLPLAFLLPLSLGFRRWIISLLLVCSIFVTLWFAGFKWRERNKAAGEAVTVVTNNIGQSNHQSMAGFLERVNPDLVVLQDAAYRLPWYRRAYPDRYCAAAGEFITISRYPISSARLLDRPQWRGPIAAVFKIEWPSHPFSLYSVHIPTPRNDFERIRGHGFLVSLVKSHGIPFGQIQTYAEAMKQRVETARAFSELLASEKEPVLVAGDFNMPSWGYVHSLFASKLEDAFAMAGQGFGFSFPGITRNPISLFGPWLRIDYLFCNHSWTPVSCVTEPHRASQHRAVAATFAWAGDGH